MWLLLCIASPAARADCPAAPIGDPDDMAVSFLAANGVQAASASLLASSIKQGTLIYDDTANALKVCDGSNWIAVGEGSGSDTLASLSCAAGEIAKFSGTAWTCANAGGGFAGPVPSFLVHRNATDQTVPASNTTSMDWTTKAFDTNNNFDLSTDRFTPTVAGTYWLNATAKCSDTPGYCIVMIFKNGSTIADSRGRWGSGDVTASASIAVQANGSSDYFAVKVFSSGTTINGGGISTYFTGGLMGGGGSDTLSGLSCTSGQVPQWNGTAWECVANGGGIPTGTIAAFAATTCPAGWTEYVAARGRFLRGIDNGASNDPSGTRAPGAAQADAVQDHTHYMSGQDLPGHGGGLDNIVAFQDTNNDGTYASGGNGTRGDAYIYVAGMKTGRISSETRPKNVAVLFCQYTGSGGGGGSGVTTLAALTDVDLTGLSNGKVLTYNSTTSKWEAVTTSSTAPAGTSTEVQFRNGGNLGADSAFTYDSANHRIMLTGDGTTLPATTIAGTMLHLGSSSLSSAIILDAFGANAGKYIFRRATGTAGAPTAVTLGSGLGQLEWQGYHGPTTGYNGSTAAKISAVAEEDWTDSTGAAGLSFSTRSAGVTTGSTERMHIDSNGNVGIGTATPGTTLEVGSFANGRGEIFINRQGTDGLEGGELQFGPGTTDDDMFYIDSYLSGGNQILRFLSDSATNILTLKKDGKVGIGTAAPIFPLHIASDSAAVLLLSQAANTSQPPILGFRRSRGTHLSPSTAAGGDLIGQIDFNAYNDAFRQAANIAAYADTGFGATGADVPGRLVFSTTPDGSASPNARMTILSNGNVGIGTTTPMRNLHIVGTGAEASLVLTRSDGLANNKNWRIMSQNTGAETAASLTFDLLNDAGSAVTTNVMNLLANGNVGIGTINPTGKLSIVGTGNTGVDITQSSVYTWWMGLLNGSAYWNLIPGGPGGTPAMTVTHTGKVGIGTTSPQYTLDVDGVINGRTSATIGYVSGSSGGIYLTPTSIYGNPSVQAVSPGFAGTSLLLNPAGGNVGIGTASPSYTLHVNGTAYATGAAGALSDIRHKKDVKSLADGALELVSKLRPVTFEWKQPRDDGMRGEQFGFIAQEVEKVLPQIVLTQNDKAKTKGLKPTELIPILTKAVQELKADNDNLRAELRETINSQDAEIEELRREVRALKVGR